MRTNSKKHLWVLAGGLILCGLWGLISIHVPMGRDQGVTAYVARILAEGGAVYRDVFHFNLPAIFFTYLLASPLGFPEGANLLQVVFNLLTMIVVYLAARRATSPFSASFAALFYGLFATIMYTDYWDVAQKESLACLPLALVFLCSTVADARGDERLPLLPLFLAGLFSGIAAQYKPTLGIVLLMPLYQSLRPGEGRFIQPGGAASAGAGFIISFVPLAIYLFATGTADDLFESVFKFGGFYGGQYYEGFFSSLWDAVRNMVKWLYDWRFLTATGVAGVVLFRMSKPHRLAVLFGFLLLVQLMIQMKFFTYHFIPLLVPMSILAASGAGGMLAILRPSGKSEAVLSGPPRALRWLVLLTLCLLLLGNLWPHARRYKREILFDTGTITRASFLKPYGPWGGGDISPMAQLAAADYIKKNTAPDDPVLVFGHELAFYILADRFPPTRFAYDQPLSTDPGGDPAFTAYRDKLRAEFMSDLAKDPPVYILVIEDDATGIEPLDSYKQVMEFDEFARLLEQDYYLETKIEDYYIYRRRGAGGRGYE